MFALAYAVIAIYVVGMVYFIADSKKESDRGVRIREAQRKRG